MAASPWRRPPRPRPARLRLCPRPIAPAGCGAGAPGAREVLGRLDLCKLARAVLWEHSCDRLKLAQLLGQLGVFVTWSRCSVSSVSREPQRMSSPGHGSGMRRTHAASWSVSAPAATTAARARLAPLPTTSTSGPHPWYELCTVCLIGRWSMPVMPEATSMPLTSGRRSPHHTSAAAAAGASTSSCSSGKISPLAIRVSGVP